MCSSMRRRLLIITLAAAWPAAGLLGVTAKVVIFRPSTVDATIQSSWLTEHGPALGLTSTTSTAIWAVGAAAVLAGLVAVLGRRRR